MVCALSAVYVQIYTSANLFDEFVEFFPGQKKDIIKVIQLFFSTNMNLYLSIYIFTLEIFGEV